MDIVTQTEQSVNTRYWSGSPVIQCGDTYIVIDRNAGFVTLLRQGEQSNVVGMLAISELRKALGNPLGFASPAEQTEDRRNEIISAVRFAKSKIEFDAVLTWAYQFDPMLMTMLRREYESKWY